MTVAELIKALLDLPPNLQVILQKDGEGNGYSPLSDVDGDALYVAETSWSGAVYSTKWSAHDAGFTAREWQAFKAKHPRCCVLSPVN